MTSVELSLFKVVMVTEEMYSLHLLHIGKLFKQRKPKDNLTTQ